mgnify:CR=1 FL=1
MRNMSKKLLHIVKDGEIVSTISFNKKSELAAFANAVIGLKKIGYGLKTSQTGDLNG